MRSSRKRRGGMALIMVLTVMSLLAAFALMNVQTLSELRYFLNRIEYKQVQKFTPPNVRDK